MEKALRKTMIKVSKESLFILLAVAGAVVLPQIFHGLGIVLGVGGKLGQIFLPMYLPVLIIGIYRGSIAGGVAGLLSPLVSHALTGMPQASLLPYITVELIATGVLAGVFAKGKLPAVLRVFLVQIIAKILRLSVLAVVLRTLRFSVLTAGIVASLPGVILQLVLVSYLIIKKEKHHAS